MGRCLEAALVVIVGGLALGGCASRPGSGSATLAPASCPAAPDSTGPLRLATVFIDGRPLATNVRARLTSAFPESYELEPPEPAAVAAIPVQSIDLIQFVRGPEAELAYRLCPGAVAFLITTKRPEAGVR
jgi:hypothetical protein